MQPLLQKLITHIDWNNQNLNRTLISAESACNALVRRNISRKEFLLESIPCNPYAALVLMQRYIKSAQLHEADYLCCKERLIEHFTGLLDEYNALSLKSASDIPYELWNGRFLLCTATALVLREDSLLEQSFSCLVRFFEERDQASVFSMDVYELLLYSGELTDNFARYYLQLYKSFPVEWCEGSAYHQASEIPVSDVLPESLITLFKTTLRNRHMRCADLLRRLFVGVKLSQIDLSPDEYMQQAWTVTDNNFYRGLLLGEHFITLISDSEAEAHDLWWNLVLKYKTDSSISWKETKSWFHFYHLSKQIILNPESAASYIENTPEVPDSDFVVHKTSEIVKATQEILFLSDRKLVFEYLKKIGCYNYYRFIPTEKQFPFNIHTVGYDMGKAIEHLLALGYSSAEMIDIYMNTCMRCSYPLHLFLRKVFFTGKELDFRGHLADMRQYFRNYPMSAKVISADNGYRLSFNNAFTGHRYYSFSPQWWAEHKQYCFEHLKKGQQVSGYITALDLQTFQPYMEPALNEEAVQLSEEFSADNLRSLVEHLRTIIKTKKLSTSTNHQISQLFISLPLSEEAQQNVDLLTLECCIALSDSPAQVRYMINMVNRMVGGRLNRYKYRYDKHKSFSSTLSEDICRQAYSCWEQLCTTALTPEEAFFVYINTMLRHIVPFSEFVLHYYKDAPDVVKLTDLLSEHTNYWFTGTIINKNYISALDAWLVQVEPFQFIRKNSSFRPDVFSYRTKDASDFQTGTIAYFQIGSFKKSTRTFFIRTLQYNQDLRMAAPFILFKKAMNQAAYRTELSSFIKKDLNIHLPDLSIRNISEMIIPMVSALEKRSDNLKAMMDYLDTIQKNNPWSCDKATCPLAEQLYLPNKSNITVRIIHLFENLTTQYSKHEFIPIYNNSLLRSFFTTEDLENAYTKKDQS